MARIPIDDDHFAGADSTPSEETFAEEANQSDATDSQNLQAERDSLYERLARATAEFKNSQKRMQTEFDQRLQFANSGLIKSLLPVIDNLERALAVDPDKTDTRSVLKGMQIAHDQWMNLLRQQQVEEISPKPGTPFDPTQHEAIMQQDSTYAVPTVVQLLQRGYALHGRTLRPAQVAVSKSV
jgi:molecular chaperone GrpE